MASASGRLIKAYTQQPTVCRLDGGAAFPAAARHHACAFAPARLLRCHPCFPALVKVLRQRDGVTGTHWDRLGCSTPSRRKVLASQGEAAGSGRPLEIEPTHTSSPIEKCPTQLQQCSECQVFKPLVDFQRTKRSAEERTDVCRACLAVIRAKRQQKELRHLALTVDEAWRAAKRCRRCGLVKELRDYRSPDTRAQCRACDSAYQALRPRPTRQEGPKQCRKCRETKGADEFFYDPRDSTGLRSMCKACDQLTTREWRKRCRKAGLYVRPETKRCADCGQEKKRADFHKNGHHLDGLVGRCIACMSMRAKAWYQGRKKRAEEAAGTLE